VLCVSFTYESFHDHELSVLEDLLENSILARSCSSLLVCWFLILNLKLFAFSNLKGALLLTLLEAPESCEHVPLFVDLSFIINNIAFVFLLSFKSKLSVFILVNLTF